MARPEASFRHPRAKRAAGGWRPDTRSNDGINSCSGGPPDVRTRTMRAPRQGSGRGFGSGQPPQIVTLSQIVLIHPLGDVLKSLSNRLKHPTSSPSPTPTNVAHKPPSPDISTARRPPKTPPPNPTATSHSPQTPAARPANSAAAFAHRPRRHRCTCSHPAAAQDRLWFAASRPAASSPACGKYGLTAPSARRNSNLPASGIRIMCVRLLPAQVMVFGDQVAPERVARR